MASNRSTLHPFVALIADLQAARGLPPVPSARADHLALCPEGEWDQESLTIDLAPLLGLESAPHRILTLKELNAMELFRVAESNQKLQAQKKSEGWPDVMCYDLALFAAMHAAPNHAGSGQRLLDLYQLFYLRAPLRQLLLYLLERVGRAWPSLVRSEVALEIFYFDERLRIAQSQAQAQALEAKIANLHEEEGEEEAPYTPPTDEERREQAEALGLLPSAELDPNASAP